MRPARANVITTASAAVALALACGAPDGNGTADGAGASNAGETAGSGEEGALDSGPGEWRVLFDGESLEHWRGFRMDSVPAGWQIVDGALTRVAEAGDLVTRDVFGDFELTLEWRVPTGGNSGVIYRVDEAVGDATYQTGPEMQVLDDAGHADGASRLTAAGSLYGLYPAPAGVVRPAGEWNEARLVVRGHHVEHWLNGTRVVEAEIGSADWGERVAASKFAAWPGFAGADSGRIALQDHGDRVQYRAIRIRELRAPE
ncbi:MAG: 3-keto-disaccharide hydrolase [Longimicrobiales bacterium]